MAIQSRLQQLRGLVIYNVTYDGRNTFYRLPLSEMTVPCGDPRSPYHRKQAFDIGNVGFGVTANQLPMGCDWLGHIKYVNGYTTNSRGGPVFLENAICLHEQDNGLQHKHASYRSRTAPVVRNCQLPSRLFVLSPIASISSPLSFIRLPTSWQL
jgi:primary-amine oxidase